MNHNRQSFHTHHSPDRRWTIHHGDVRQVTSTLSRCSFDGILCDPPYGIDFMGNNWDYEVPPAEIWRNFLLPAKPGAYLLAFGGPRTFHRLFCNIEDGEWNLRDTVAWLHAQGMPKGHNIGRELKEQGYDGWHDYHTCLKPYWEPICVAQKPFKGSFATNARKHGCGGLNIGDCRVGTGGGTRRSHQAPYPRQANGKEDRTKWARPGHSVETIDAGRFPANAILDEGAAELLDRQSGQSRSRRTIHRNGKSNPGHGRAMNSLTARLNVVDGYDDEGGASRFYYVAKASGKEREDNSHSTIKPLALCRYLARLMLQPQRKTPRRLLVPFCGSGSEMIGALQAGWDQVVGIEINEEYAQTAIRRLSAISIERDSA